MYCESACVVIVVLMLDCLRRLSCRQVLKVSGFLFFFSVFVLETDIKKREKKNVCRGKSNKVET